VVSKLTLAGWPAEVEFAWIVARLVVDVDVARVVGCALFLEPRVGHPRAVFRDGEQIAAAPVGEPARGLRGTVEGLRRCLPLSAGLRARPGRTRHRGNRRGDLVIDDSEGAASEEVRVIHPANLARGEQAGFAQARFGKIAPRCTGSMA